ncbi:hypothetical protein H2248_004016 [Termitomyces sp. 'cryptogamus']|nr:hypothetical protein H2248_004016 [Termitomyces sp. 'cryptogamus']
MNLESVNAQVQAVKEQVKRGMLDLEELRVERAEVEKAVKMARVGLCCAVDDSIRRYTALTNLHRSMVNLQTSHAASENELRFTYGIDPQVEGELPHRVTITLLFAPDTGKLAVVQTEGLGELGVVVGDVIEAHLQIGDV